MARGYEVMQMLRPNGGWIMNGEDYEGITFLECEPISKADFEAGFAQYIMRLYIATGYYYLAPMTIPLLTELLLL